VPADQAASILKVATVHEVEAPLGPTCILEAQGQRLSPTIAVEVVDINRDVHRMTHPSRTMLGHRSAYCGKLGASILLVPLNRYEALNVTAPCPVATELARAALRRINA